MNAIQQTPAERLASLAYTVDEAAEQLRVGRSTVQKLLNAGELPSVKIGRCRRIRAADLQQYLKNLSP